MFKHKFASDTQPSVVLILSTFIGLLISLGCFYSYVIATLISGINFGNALCMFLQIGLCIYQPGNVLNPPSYFLYAQVLLQFCGIVLTGIFVNC